MPIAIGEHGQVDEGLLRQLAPDESLAFRLEIDVLLPPAAVSAPERR